MICPGIFVAKASKPGAPCAVYRVIKSDPPPTTRLKRPPNPPPLPIPVVVCKSMDWLIHESSPDTATMLSPGAN
jgi:hypothetical protein